MKPKDHYDSWKKFQDYSKQEKSDFKENGNTVSRSFNHRFRSNNWLKQHGEPMRRIPFKKEFLVYDEYYDVLVHGLNGNSFRNYLDELTKLTRKSI